MDKINKLILPATILIASLILGGFFYASQTNKQRSIEKQQLIKIKNEKRIEEAKAEQVKKEYTAKRKGECYDIEQRERKNFNNVVSSFYHEMRDICYVHYKTDKYDGYTKEDCEKEFGKASPETLGCELGEFSKQF